MKSLELGVHFKKNGSSPDRTNGIKPSQPGLNLEIISRIHYRLSNPNTCKSMDVFEGESQPSKGCFADIFEDITDPITWGAAERVLRPRNGNGYKQTYESTVFTKPSNRDAF